MKGWEYMAVFKLYNVEKSDMYANKPEDEKEKIRIEMVKMALDRGVKPSARYYKTYPSTVRKWLKIYKEQGEEGLKIKK